MALIIRPTTPNDRTKIQEVVGGEDCTHLVQDENGMLHTAGTISFCIYAAYDMLHPYQGGTLIVSEDGTIKETTLHGLRLERIT